jgi:hypothetical protein
MVKVILLEETIISSNQLTWNKDHLLPTRLTMEASARLVCLVLLMYLLIVMNYILLISPITACYIMSAPQLQRLVFTDKVKLILKKLLLFNMFMFVYFPGGSFVTGIPNKGGISDQSLSRPGGVFTSASLGVFIADTENNRVLAFSDVLTTAIRVFGQGIDCSY